MGSGPALSREVHFPFLLLTFMFNDLPYIYQDSLRAEEISSETVVPTSSWQCSPVSKPLTAVYRTKILEQIYPSTVLFLEFSLNLDQTWE